MARSSTNARRRGGHGFSLIELLVVVAILVILATMGYTALWRSRGASKDTVCRNHLKQIAMAMGLYYNDSHAYPSESLPTALAPYVGDSPDLFICPADPDPQGDSYSRFYVGRSDDETQSYVCACPRHVGATRAITLFSSASAQMLEVKPVLWNGQEVPPGASVGSGVLRFGDGSRVTIPPGLVVRLIQSFRQHDGRFYSLIGLDINETGTLDVQVTPGSRFEVVTPGTITGVRGTRFRVTASIEDALYRVTVEVMSGTVWMHRRWHREEARVLSAHEERTIDYPRRLISARLPLSWAARRVVLPDDYLYAPTTSDANNEPSETSTETGLNPTGRTQGPGDGDTTPP